MIREEELKQAAYRQYCNSESVCFTLMCDSFKQGALWAESTYVKGDIEKESESYAQGVVGDISEDIRHLLATAYIAGAKRINL